MSTEEKSAGKATKQERLMLIGGGAVFAGLVIGIAVLLAPNLIRPRIVFRAYDGDAFRYSPGQVRPPEENEIVENYPAHYGGDGFRVPAMEAREYPIIALGDSYTEGGSIPWVDVLAEELDTPVQNLSWRGYGPLEYAAVMEEYGSGDHDWVLIGYFEGNDLSNVHSSTDLLEETGSLNLSRELFAAEGVEQMEVLPPDPDRWYLFPLRHLVGDQVYELAYIPDYLWGLNGNEEAYRQSRNVALLRESLQEIKTLAGDACVGLVYIPDKPHIYFPYSDPDGNRQWLLNEGAVISLDADGWLSLDVIPRPAPQEFETVVGNLDNQRDVIGEVAAELGIHFIDLTPALQAAVETGEPTYFTYDSHWNARGHEVGGAAAAEYIRSVEGCGAP